MEFMYSYAVQGTTHIYSSHFEDASWVEFMYLMYQCKYVEAHCWFSASRDNYSVLVQSNVQLTIKGIITSCSVCHKHFSAITVLTKVTEMCEIHDACTPVWPFLPETAILQQEICMLHVRALTSVITTPVWFGRNGCLSGSNQGFSSLPPRHKLSTLGC